MKWLLILSLALVSFRAEDGGCLRLDIILVGDYSSSVKGSEGFIVDAFQAFADRFELSEEDLKIGIITFAGDPSVMCPLTSDKELLNGRLKILRLMQADGDATDISSALQASTNLLLSNGRYNVRKMIILVSDGQQNQSKGDGFGVDGFRATAAMVRKMGIILCTIAVDDNNPNYSTANKAVMEEVASPGFYVESSYGTLVDVLKKMDICM